VKTTIIDPYVNKTKYYLEEQNIPGIEEYKSDCLLGNPELIMDIDREKARRIWAF